ncbi:hypothetical protein [Burkholderia phage BCSR129]|nr:hypothetical protein [Burkholderia phage BCSR129]
MLKNRCTCPVEGCDRPVYASGYCYPHWFRWDRNGRRVKPYPDFKIDLVRRVLKVKPHTITEIARALGIAEVTARHLVRQSGATVLLELHAPGNNAKCRYWTYLKADRAMTIALIQRTLENWPSLTADEIARHLRMSESSLRKNLSYLHKAGFVYISRWRMENTALERCWSFGFGQDEPRPKAMTPSERSAKFNARCKVDPEARARRKGYKEREAKRKSFRVPAPDPLTAALFGSANTCAD